MSAFCRCLPVKIASLSLILLAVPLQAADEDVRWTTQVPVVAESVLAGDREASRGAVPADLDFSGGPEVQWIWGEATQPADRYFFRKTFAGSRDVESAALIASCDNRLTVWLNGQRVLQSDNWQTPARADVGKHVRDGENVLLVEAGNDGGPAALALKLVLTDSDGQRRYVVTDGTWQAAHARDAQEWFAAHRIGAMGMAPWGDVFSAPAGGLLADIPRDVFNVLPGFQVELLYTVPKETHGSWVSIAFDPQGRLLASDQGDLGLSRVTLPPVGSNEPTRVEKLDLPITSAQGMLHAFGALYLSVNGGPGSGFYRARDTDGDDQYDKLDKLKDFRGGGEHGPHAVRLSPDGNSLYVIAGNHTDPPELDASRIPTNWAEDLLLPRQWDARGHARGRLAPGGWICKTDPEGRTWEMFSVGYRNPYDMDFNADGELFAYDADMEWDLGTPWYRPTRAVHATSGSEFGWRSGTGKWPEYYADSLPPVVNIGPGSPTGVVFGTAARFPARYQQALFLADWTFGTIYAVHLTPKGASYTGEKEEFLSRAPLPLTDLAVGPDGALYFTVGGRGTQSELYRVIYVGGASTDAVKPADDDSKESQLRRLRRRLESLHRDEVADSRAIEMLWPHLGHADRHIRYAARVALEHQDPVLWQQRALEERDPQRLITSMVALARQGQPSLLPQVLDALERIPFAKQVEQRQLELLRAYSLAFIRLGQPDAQRAQQIVRRLDPHFPAASDALNRELVNLLAYLNSPTVISKTLELMAREEERRPAVISELLARNAGYGGTIAQMLANEPELQKIHYAFALRTMRYGWTLEQRREYLKWFESALTRSGGASYEGFLNNIRAEALENMSEAERAALAETALPKPPAADELPRPQGPGREWSLQGVVDAAEGAMIDRSFENGRRAFAAARCVVCHRFDGRGGATGPDLTNVAGRFSLRDLTEAISDPSKVISDQYRASVVETADGRILTGRIGSEQDGKLTLLTDPEDASKVVELEKEDIEHIEPSKTSLMPADLLNQLNREEVLDLLAYLLSRGNPQDPIFRAPQ